MKTIKTSGNVSGEVEGTFGYIYKFLTNIIRSSGGYFTSDKDRIKYENLKLEAIGKENEPMFSGQGSITSENGIDTIQCAIHYTIDFSDKDSGRSLNKSGPKVLQIITVDNNGVLNHKTIGKSGKEKIKFTRDETYNPKKVEDFDNPYNIGDKITEVLRYNGYKETKNGGRIYSFYKDNIKFISFAKREELNALNKLYKMDDGKSINVNDNIIVDFIIKDKNVYQNELNYIISVLGIKYTNEQIRQKEIEQKEKERKIKEETMKNLWGLLEPITPKDQLNEFRDRHLSDESQTTTNDLIKDFGDIFSQNSPKTSGNWYRTIKTSMVYLKKALNKIKSELE